MKLKNVNGVVLEYPKNIAWSKLGAYISYQVWAVVSDNVQVDMIDSWQWQILTELEWK